MGTEHFYVVPEGVHHALVEAAYRGRGFTAEESEMAARFSGYATRHGIRTHNAIKALHLDEHFGSKAGGCVPGAEIEVVNRRFEASEVWNAHLKLGQAVAYAAMDRAMELADRFGVGQVSVDRAFHYLWGGGYVMEAARKGYIAYTNCTAALAEVVPFQGIYPTLGTNPHSWGFPTTEELGFPIVIDWATSVIAVGRVQQLAREGAELPPMAAVDSEGKPTRNPQEVAALMPFGAHKGYGLSLINEIVAAFIGGSRPTVRCRPERVPEAEQGSEKFTPSFYFQVIHPDALSSGSFAGGRSQAENVGAVIADILGHGNENCLLPGQIEARAAAETNRAGGLLFSKAEVEALNGLAVECGHPVIELSALSAYSPSH